DSLVGKHDLLGMRDDHFTMLRRRGCRNLPWLVHSINPTRTTIVGCTQCARTRGKPTALVNGGFSISNLSNCARRSSSISLSNPVPILPAKTKSPSLCCPTNSPPSPTRFPCGSVKPPTTNSSDNSHFIFNHSRERRCSYVEPRRLAMTPSQPSLCAS